uniref:Metalloendopeptidase n=1 Tax=Timema tahoe TaxID=61484 RepID=A0A7R9IAW1_9NEOP|nr:unnamed protein product [Timema tahoe]
MNSLCRLTLGALMLSQWSHSLPVLDPSYRHHSQESVFTALDYSGVYLNSAELTSGDTDNCAPRTEVQDVPAPRSGQGEEQSPTTEPPIVWTAIELDYPNYEEGGLAMPRYSNSYLVPLMPDTPTDTDAVPEEGNFFEGDIILRFGQDMGEPEPTDAEELANFSLWPNATLYYQMGLEFDTDQAKKIREAMDNIQERSCVRFLPRSGDTPTYVQLQNMGDKCASHVGYTPRIGPIDLYLSSPRCLKRGSIQHELFHSLGFWHEHNRSDRNKFVTIIWGNIKQVVGCLTPAILARRDICAGREHDFRSRPQMRHRSKRLPYDYGSVMHYRAKAFSKNRRIPTIVPRDPHALYKIGQRKRYSEIDLAKLNRMYNCGPEYYSGTDIDAKKKDAGSTTNNKTAGNAASSSTTTPLPIVSVKFV